VGGKDPPGFSSSWTLKGIPASPLGDLNSNSLSFIYLLFIFGDRFINIFIFGDRF